MTVVSGRPFCRMWKRGNSTVNAELFSRCAAEDDPSRTWNLLNDGLMHIAKRHFTVCRGGSKPWMSAATWDLIQCRDRQLKEWASHVCLVRVGVAQVF